MTYGVNNLIICATITDLHPMNITPKPRIIFIRLQLHRRIIDRTILNKGFKMQHPAILVETLYGQAIFGSQYTILTGIGYDIGQWRIVEIPARACVTSRARDDEIGD